MKRISIIVVLLLMAATFALGGSYTTSGLLYKPDVGEGGYGSLVSANFDTLDDVVHAPLSQCRFVKSGSNLVLQRYNGDRLMINGVNRIIPAGGVSLAPTGLTPNTTYNIYAFMNGATMTLEAATTAHATSTSTGLEIKSGDATRTLVGMARIITGPAWVDTATQRFVLSWFNGRDIIANNIFTTTRTTASTSNVELNTEIRCEFLTWAAEAVEAHGGGSLGMAAAGYGLLLLAYDGTPEDINMQVNYPDFQSVNFKHKKYLSEGYHYATFMARVSASTLSVYSSNTAGLNTTLAVIVKG